MCATDKYNDRHLLQFDLWIRIIGFSQQAVYFCQQTTEKQSKICWFCISNRNNVHAYPILAHPSVLDKPCLTTSCCCIFPIGVFLTIGYTNNPIFSRFHQSHPPHCRRCVPIHWQCTGWVQQWGSKCGGVDASGNASTHGTSVCPHVKVSLCLWYMFGSATRPQDPTSEKSYPLFPPLLKHWILFFCSQCSLLAHHNVKKWHWWDAKGKYIGGRGMSSFVHPILWWPVKLATLTSSEQTPSLDKRQAFPQI